MSKIYFFRHAQASYGAVNYDKLSLKGEQQSAALGKHFAEQSIRFDRIFVGPLERQKHTLNIVREMYKQQDLTLPNPIVLPELKEHHGFQATKKALPEFISSVPLLRRLQSEVDENPALQRRNSLLMSQYFIEEWAEGRVEVAGFESWKMFRENVTKGLTTILDATEKGETVGVFTSGGTISAIIANVLNLKEERKVAAMNFSIRNTSFSTLLYSENKLNLMSLNELPHLSGDMVTFV